MKSNKKQFLFDLADIYDAEQRVARVLPRMIREDTSQELKSAIHSKAREMEEHIIKVEQIFECFGCTVRENTGRTLEELMAEGDEIAAEFIGSLASASQLISSLQSVEYPEVETFCQREWEIASYGCLKEWASLLGNSDAADLMEQILREEKEANQLIADRILSGPNGHAPADPPA